MAQWVSRRIAVSPGPGRDGFKTRPCRDRGRPPYTRAVWIAKRQCRRSGAHTPADTLKARVDADGRRIRNSTCWAWSVSPRWICPAVKHILLLCSTWGEGDMPDNAAAFWGWLKSDQAATLTHAAFAVLGLGDRNYRGASVRAEKISMRASPKLGARRLPTLRMRHRLTNRAPTSGWKRSLRNWNPVRLCPLCFHKGLWRVQTALPSKQPIESIQQKKPLPCPAAGEPALEREGIGEGHAPSRLFLGGQRSGLQGR